MSLDLFDASSFTTTTSTTYTKLPKACLGRRRVVWSTNNSDLVVVCYMAATCLRLETQVHCIA